MMMWCSYANQTGTSSFKCRLTKAKVSGGVIGDHYPAQAQCQMKGQLSLEIPKFSLHVNIFCLFCQLNLTGRADTIWATFINKYRLKRKRTFFQ